MVLRTRIAALKVAVRINCSGVEAIFVVEKAVVLVLAIDWAGDGQATKAVVVAISMVAGSRVYNIPRW